MPLTLQPRIRYHQPSALCRTLVYAWGGLLLARAGTETEILGQLPVNNAAAIPWTTAHRGPLTKAYKTEGGWSQENVFTFRGRQYRYIGYVIHKEQQFGDADPNNKLRLSLMSLLAETVSQAAYGLSLHYEYPGRADNVDHGHTLGVFHSRGGPSARRVGCRFFDPNLGSWLFDDPKDFLEFFSNDWLTNYLAGTVSHDPGHPRAEARELKHFRLIGITLN